MLTTPRGSKQSTPCVASTCTSRSANMMSDNGEIEAVVVSIADGVTDAPQEIVDITGVYARDGDFDGRPLFTRPRQDEPAREWRYIFWQGSAWWNHTEIGGADGFSWCNCEDETVPKSGWVARTGWFGGACDAPLTVTQRRKPAPCRTVQRNAGNYRQSLNPTGVAGKLTGMYHSTKESSQRSLSSAKQLTKDKLAVVQKTAVDKYAMAQEHVVPKAKEYSNKAVIHGRTAAVGCSDFFTHPDTIGCIKASGNFVKEVGLACIDGCLSVVEGICGDEAVRKVSKGRQASKGRKDSKEGVPIEDTLAASSSDTPAAASLIMSPEKTPEIIGKNGVDDW